MAGEARVPPAGSGCSDAGDLDPFRPGRARLIGEARQVIDVAGEQDHRPRLGQRYHGDQRIKGTPVTGHPGPAQQLAGRPARFFLNADHSDSAKDAMQRCVSRPAAQNLRKGRCCRDNPASSSTGRLEAMPDPGIAASELDEAFRVQDQRAPYSFS